MRKISSNKKKKNYFILVKMYFIHNVHFSILGSHNLVFHFYLSCIYKP